MGSVRVCDQINWDLGNEDQKPEAFARKLRQDLDVDCNFEQQIAWQIRSQVRLTSERESHYPDVSMR